MEKNLELIAAKNLSDLKNNVYPGRGIIVGLDETAENLIQVYWIGGRSKNSQNRIFTEEPRGFLETTPLNPDVTTQNNNLTIYTAMAEKDLRYVVSNGHQTLSILKGNCSCCLEKLLKCWTYEPDEPNFTPRISALINLGELNEEFDVEFGILSKSAFDEKCERGFFKLPLRLPGMGYCVHTYSGNGNPLPPFEGAPYVVPLIGGIEDIKNTFWDILNPETRVALAVKFIDTRSGQSIMTIKNRFESLSVAV